MRAPRSGRSSACSTRSFGIDDVREAELRLTRRRRRRLPLEGASAMSQISRDPEDIVGQTIGPNHQYPDGFVLYLGTMFAPTEDRGAPGQGFTHKIGDVVTRRVARARPADQRHGLHARRRALDVRHRRPDAQSCQTRIDLGEFNLPAAGAAALYSHRRAFSETSSAPPGHAPE